MSDAAVRVDGLSHDAQAQVLTAIVELAEQFLEGLIVEEEMSLKIVDQLVLGGLLGKAGG